MRKIPLIPSVRDSEGGRADDKPTALQAQKPSVQWLLGTPAPHFRPSVPLRHTLGGTKSWLHPDVPATHEGNPEEAPGSRIWPGPALAAAGI